MNKGLALSERSESNGFAPLVIVIILALIGVIGYLGYQNYLLKSPTPPASLSPAPSITPDPTENWKAYTGDFDAYSLQYPPTWAYTTKTIKKGSGWVNDPGHYTINPDEGDVEVTRFTKGNYEIEISAKKEFVQDSCGGINGSLDNANWTYKDFSLNGTIASRVKLEDGKFWAGGDATDPYPQPILFPGDSNWEYKSCLENTAKTSRVSLVYYSKDFTAANIEAMRLDYDIIAEMDQILSTFQFTK